MCIWYLHTKYMYLSGCNVWDRFLWWEVLGCIILIMQDSKINSRWTMFFKCCLWFGWSDSEKTTKLKGFQSLRVQQPHPSVWRFFWIPKPLAFFISNQMALSTPHSLLLVNASGSKLSNLQSCSWNRRKRSGAGRPGGGQRWLPPGSLSGTSQGSCRRSLMRDLRCWTDFHYEGWRCWCTSTHRELLVKMHTSRSEIQRLGRGSLAAKSFQGTLFQRGKN